MNKIIVDVEIKSDVWKKIRNIKNFVKKTCQELILETELKNFKNPINLSVSLVSDAQIKKINHKFRNKNKATDVLSFPFLDEEMIRKNGVLKSVKNYDNLFLGDVVLSLEKSRKDAILSGKNLKNHFTHLLLHSILHLIAFDHENENDAKKMEEIEVRILKKFNIENPYKC